MKVSVYNIDGVESGTREFDLGTVPTNKGVVHQVLLAELAGRRQGTASTKTKGLVRGGGKKPFKQKGTGSARQGSSRSPLNPGGGSAFGPQPRCYKQRTPKKMMKSALKMVLADKIAAGKFLVVQGDLKQCSTKAASQLLNDKLTCGSAVFLGSKDTNLFRSSRNLKSVKAEPVEAVGIHSLLKFEFLVVAEADLLALHARCK